MNTCLLQSHFIKLSRRNGSLWDEFTNILYSVILVGKISPHITSHHDVGKFYECLSSSFAPPDHITGLLMVYPYHVINIIELSFRALMKFFRAVSETEKISERCKNWNTEQINNVTMQEMFTKNHMAPTTHTRILCAVDNVVCRMYRTYEVLEFDMEPTRIYNYDSHESDEKKLLNLLSQVNKLSIYLAEKMMSDQSEYITETFKQKLTEILSNIRQFHPELIPQQVAVGYFSDISSYEGIIPIQEYMRLYDIPYETSLQSELTWPIATNSFIYN
ncbi:hypothetical protein MN116_001547 [Schistosoma mekongi]|uniref:Uncharacterized protein n=1 Tax=Schistosoma mekongi TaxID=38744 RepID=A0AAE2D7W3_SCHME|nr:hypothetical protein MN116_001547 [Schistosoma mekongi]